MQLVEDALTLLAPKIAVRSRVSRMSPVRMGLVGVSPPGRLYLNLAVPFVVRERFS